MNYRDLGSLSKRSRRVGDAIADIIAKLHKTGTHAGLEAMRKDVPAGVLELLSVPGLRPEKSAQAL